MQEGRRAARIGKLIQVELSDMILKGLKDPGLEMVSITGVDVTEDLQAAKVFFCIFGPESKRTNAVRAFGRASGFIRRELIHRLELRKVPELSFHYDSSFDQGDRIERLLKEAGAGGGNEQEKP